MAWVPPALLLACCCPLSLVKGKEPPEFSSLVIQEVETLLWWHEEVMDSLLQAGQFCSARPSRTQGEGIPTAASITCWKTQGSREVMVA